MLLAHDETGTDRDGDQRGTFADEAESVHTLCMHIVMHNDIAQRVLLQMGLGLALARLNPYHM